MEVSEIESFTRQELPAFSGKGELNADVIDRSGSGRRFVRFSQPGGESVFAMHYSTARQENTRFVEITRFLGELGVPVPEVLGFRKDQQLIWLQDLGADDLAGKNDDDWETVRAPLYRATLEAVFLLHRCAESDPPDNLPDLESGFDAGLYRWEQDYFFEKFASRMSDCPAADLEEIRKNEDLARIAHQLGALPRYLIHRDFQSSNVMIQGGRPWLIDYQGMRWGVPEYDLASLLYDPYVDLKAEHRDQLALHYFSLKTAAGDPESFDTYSHRLRLCAAQRLMQALGAYVYLGIENGQKSFLNHIPPALARLREITIERETIPSLAPALSLNESRVA